MDALHHAFCTVCSVVVGSNPFFSKPRFTPFNMCRGPGVVGEQPILEPGKSFEYQSACPLFTTVGTMEGEYEMVVINSQGEWGDKFEVKIGKFALRKPEDV